MDTRTDTRTGIRTQETGLDAGLRVRSAEPAVPLRGLTRRFGDVTAVNGLDLTVEPGEVVAFLRPNGAGTTSTIDVVLGLAQPTTGAASVYGTTPRGAVANGWVSAVLQTGGLLKDLTVRETVELTASLFSRTQPVDVVLRRAGTDGTGDRQVATCSGGEQQRLRFAMALLPDPRLLVLDEPTTGMDVEGRRAFWVAVRADADRGRTVLFATHYLQEADSYADRIVLVARGRVVADGTPSQVKALTAGRTVRATWEGVTPAALEGMPGIEDLEVSGDRITVQASNSDAIARHLLTHTPACDVQITTHGLEDAFISLTSTPQEDPR